MIEVKDLVKLYGDRKVLHKLNFSVGVGRVCGFLGPNGAGKSTTMDILAGLTGPSDGTAVVCGYDVITQTREVKAAIGYLPDNPHLYKEMRVADFVTYCASLRGVPSGGRSAAVEQALIDCDIQDVASRLIGNLSKGYRQRVALASALVHQPKVLILDEPVSALDVSIQAQVLNLLVELQNELRLTYLFISHDLSVANHICDQIAVMYLGKVVEMGSRDKIFNNPLHPYTKALMASSPSLHGKVEHTPLKGELPSPLNPPPGCSFHKRCPVAVEDCRIKTPELLDKFQRQIACDLV